MCAGDSSHWQFFVLSSECHTATFQSSRTAQTSLCEEWGTGIIPEPQKRLGHLQCPTSSHQNHHLHQNILWRCLVLGKGIYNLQPVRADMWVCLWLLYATGSPYTRKVCEQQLGFLKRPGSVWQGLSTIKFQLILSDSSVFSLLTEELKGHWKHTFVTHV